MRSVAPRGVTGEIKKLVEKLKAAAERKRPSTGASTALGDTTSRSALANCIASTTSSSIPASASRCRNIIIDQNTGSSSRELRRDHGQLTKRALHENQSTYIPIGTVHRLANPGLSRLELIEVQVGVYLGEDDVIRIETLTIATAILIVNRRVQHQLHTM